MHARPHSDSQLGDTPAITRQGHLRIPAPIRHLCGLTTGARLLVTVAPGNHLIIYPMAALAEVLNPDTRTEPT